MNQKELEKAGLTYPQAQVEALVSHTETPTDELDLVLALDGYDACWRVPKAPQTLAKKKIIISDWSMRYRLFDDYSEVRLWDDLLAQGFELFAWTGALKPIKNSSELVATLKKISSIHVDDLQLRLGALGISKEESYIADFAHTRKLLQTFSLQGKNAHTTGISAFTFAQNSGLPLERIIDLPNEELDALLDSIPDAPRIYIHIKNSFSAFLKPRVLSFINKHHLFIDVGSDNEKIPPNTGAIGQLLNSLPQLSSVLIFDLEDASYLKNIRPNKWQNLHVYANHQLGPFIISNCHSLKSFSGTNNRADYYYTIDNIGQPQESNAAYVNPSPNKQSSKEKYKLRYFSALRPLDMSKQPNLNNWINTSALRGIDLSQCAINDTLLAQFWTNNPLLNVLLINKCIGLTENALVNMPTRNLAMLDARIGIRINNFHESSALWQSCSQLVSLRIDKFETLERIFKKNGAPTKIRTLAISMDTHLNQEQFAFIFQMCPDLISLKLIAKSISDYSENPFKAALALNKLRILEIGHYNISTENVSKLLWSSPELEDFKLYSCNIVGTNVIDAPTKNLKSLSIEASKMSQASRYALLQSCPTLHSLQIADSNTYGDYIPSQLSLTKLRTLYLKLGDVETERHFPDFSTCRHLMELIITGEINIKNSFLKNGVQFVDLQKVELHSSSITMDELSIFLHASPHLTELTLESCQELTGVFSKTFVLNDLKLLKIHECNIESEQISILLHSCPELTDLSLSTVNNIIIPGNRHDLSKLMNLKIETENNNTALLQLSQILSRTNARLVDLNMEKCKHLSLDNIRRVDFSRLNALQTLDVSDSDIDEDSITYILQFCPLLTLLNISDCENLSNTYISNITQMAPPRLKIRDISCYQRNQNTANKNIRANPKELVSLDDITVSSIFSLAIDQVFYEKSPGDPEESFYRKQVCTGIDVQPHTIQSTLTSIKSMIEMKQINRYEIHKIYRAHSSNPELYLGEITLPALSHDWICLPGLTTNDDLKHISVDPEEEIDIAYCELTACYYVKPKNIDRELTISYILQTTSNKIENATIAEWIEMDTSLLNTLQLNINEQGGIIVDPHFLTLSYNQKVCMLVAYFNQFKAEKLNATSNNKIQLLNNILREKKGVCRHRTLAFMAVAKQLGINARSVSNDLHMFVEIYDKDNETWVTADLGGGSVRVEIKKLSQFNAEEPPKEREETHAASTTQSQVNVIAADNDFITWNTRIISAEGMVGYLEELLACSSELAPGKNNLLSLIDRNQIESVYAHVCKLTHAQGYRFYMMNDLDHISESQIVIDNDTGDYRHRDSQLSVFLKQAKKGDVLVVNWSDYEAKHVGLNSMMDTPRSINGMAIPDGVAVIALFDKQQTMGEDFYSRFSVVTQCPDHMPTYSLVPVPVKQLSDSQNLLAAIPFYGDDWRSTLLGRYDISLGKYQFIESDFVTAIRNGHRELVLQNAPWHLPEFRLFMMQMQTQGEFIVNGLTITLPADFNIIHLEKPLSLQVGEYSISDYCGAEMPENSHILNSYSFNMLFNTYHFTKEDLPEILPGIIETHANTTLYLIVTESLLDNQWVKILEAAAKQKVKLHIEITTGVSLPVNMQANMADNTLITHQNHEPVKTRAIVCNDIDYLSDDEKYDSVFSVNENTTYANLIESIKLGYRDNKRTFKHKISFLAEKLLAGDSVVLKGNISRAIAKQLESVFSERPYLLINGIKTFLPETARLTFLTTQKSISPLIASEEVIITEEEIWNKLSTLYSPKSFAVLKNTCDAFYANTNETHFSYIQLKNMLKRMERMPNKNPLSPFLRLRKNYVELVPIAKAAFRPHKTKKRLSSSVTDISTPIAKVAFSEHIQKHSAYSTSDINAKRLEKVLNELDISPYVFVAGPSGVGKSYFVQKSLKDQGWCIHEGLDNLEKILNPIPAEKTVIFVDEANLYAQGKFSFLEGLSDNPPGIILNGEFIVVPPHIKFVFSGNFGHFQGRQQQTFFLRHGHVITFKEFPDAYLRESILRETLCLTAGDNHTMVEDMFLSAYHHVNDLFPDTHPLTPRNLYSLAMRFAYLIKTLSDPKQIAALAIYDEVSGMLTKTERQHFAAYLEETYSVSSIKEMKHELKKKVNLPSSAFMLTKERKNIVRLFDCALQMRDIKMRQSMLAASGTAGILLEGESGLGKSLMTKAYLETRGFYDGDVHIDAVKRYYHIKTAVPEKMKAQLLKAFHEGAIVIIDEINTLAIEHLLNPLLSGVDLDGKAAKNPGFFLIGTQNPITFDKRQALSSALLNRLQVIPVKAYGRKSLLEITGDTDMVDRFFAAKEYAERHRLKPEPTPRDLFRKSTLRHVSKKRTR